MRWCVGLQQLDLAIDETSVTTASQADSSDDDDDDNDVDDIDDYDDKEWISEATDVTQLNSTNVLTTRQVTPLTNHRSMWHDWSDSCRSIPVAVVV